MFHVKRHGWRASFVSRAARQLLPIFTLLSCPFLILQCCILPDLYSCPLRLQILFFAQANLPVSHR